jgi:hypothetical protein
MADPDRPKHPGGRPRYVPTEADRKIVAFGMACGVPQDRIIAELMGREGHTISKSTMFRRFKDEIAHGKELALAYIKQSIYQKAMGDGPQSVTACIFILKCQAGWRDRSYVTVEHEAAELSDWELARIAAGEVIERASGEGVAGAADVGEVAADVHRVP